MRRLLLLLCLTVSAFGQSESFNHVHWTMTIDPSTAAPGATVLAKLTAQVDPEWHMYSLTTPPGPIPTTIKTTMADAVANVTFFEPPPVRKYDPNFQADTETYEGTQVFLARIELKKALPSTDVTVGFQPRYQTCSGTQCIPARTADIEASVKIVPGTPAAAVIIPAGYIEGKPAATAPVGIPASTPADAGIFSFLALAFGAGLAAIFTPCVFPMIPITMSYFTGKQGAVSQAVAFCFGIIFVITALGAVTTLAFGSAGVVQLGSNPWVNGFIAAIFFVFGLSLLGAFEITIPSGILTRMNNASNAGGYFGAVLMGLTFALASFACIGPFMGTLLAASVTGGALRPIVGMATFSTGLALPFFLLALFPGFLTKLPRSGEWLSRVKVVMGFFVLAAMLKYLYSLDAVLQTGFLTRERFLAAWVVLFAMAGFYLLGFVRLPGISADSELGVPRLLIGMALVVFAITLIPGMLGGRLGELESYIPPPGTQSAGGAGGAGGELAWVENDLDGAFAQAKAGSKYVLVNFTGYACTNCHWMKANMFTKPEIASVMKNMVLVDLYTDGTDAASVANQKLEEDKFKTVAIPFYVLYDSDRNVVATFPGLTRNPSEYLSFLNTKSSASTATAAAAPAAGGLDGLPFHTMEGTPISLADYKGKVVVLNYWATWCIPCRSEIPEFNRIHKDLGEKGVQFVGISTDDDGAPVVQKFLKTNPITYQVGLSTGMGNLGELPVTIVFDRNGNTVKRFDGIVNEEDLRAAIADAQKAG
ncbi:MAG TPA: cytochrome c biogenesis protein CcdA [Bryobacteraceae bacterium]|nr:cytochrome c biogenesis protein CcdA [Bryobacteraceae bacterium]